MLTLSGLPLNDPNGRWKLNRDTNLKAFPPRLSIGQGLPGRDGSLPSLGSTFGPATFPVGLTIKGADRDAAESGLELLFGIIGQRHKLLSLVDTVRGREAQVEILESIEPDASSARFQRITLVCQIPSVFWRDLVTVDATASITGSTATTTLTTLAGTTGSINDALIRFQGGFSTATITDPVSGDQLQVTEACAPLERILIDSARWTARKEAVVAGALRARNYCTNPSFEAGITGWATPSTVTAIQYDHTTSAGWPAGAWRARYTFRGETKSGAGTFTYALSGLIPVTAGEYLAFAAQVASASGSALRARAVYTDAAGAGVSSSGAESGLRESTNIYDVGTLACPAHVVPAGAVNVRVGYYIYGSGGVAPTVGARFYVDAVMCRRGTTATDVSDLTYVDGDQPSSVDGIYAWDGTPNASTSTVSDGEWSDVGQAAVESNRGSGPMFTLNPEFSTGAGRVRLQVEGTDPAGSPVVEVRTKRSFL